TLFADLPRKSDDRVDSLPAALDVARECLQDVRLSPGYPYELLGEHGGVFHGHAGTLTHVRRERVRRVAEERDAPACPCGQVYFLGGGAQAAAGRLEPAERPPHSRVSKLREERPERRRALERPGAAFAGRVEGRPHVELAGADRDEPDTPA